MELVGETRALPLLPAVDMAGEMARLSDGWWFICVNGNVDVINNTASDDLDSAVTYDTHTAFL